MATEHTEKDTFDRDTLPVSLRKDESEYVYVNFRKEATFLTDPRLREWRFWAIIENNYPYDMAFEIHHLLIPKRIVSEQNLTEEEKLELEKIVVEIGDDYDARLMNFHSTQSVRDHFHIHLLKYKSKREDLVF